MQIGDIDKIYEKTYRNAHPLVRDVAHQFLTLIHGFADTELELAWKKGLAIPEEETTGDYLLGLQDEQSQ